MTDADKLRQFLKIVRRALIMIIKAIETWYNVLDD